MGFIGKLFCGALIAVGAYLGGEHLGTVADGVRLASAGVPKTVRVDGKRVEPRRQGGRASGAVAISTGGEGGIRVQSIDTYLRSYLLEVSFLAEEGRATAVAPVSYAAYLEARPGGEIRVTARPGIAYVDVTPHATLLYGLKSIGLGALMIAVGVVVLLLPKRTDDQDEDDDGGFDIDPHDVLRRARERG